MEPFEIGDLLLALSSDGSYTTFAAMTIQPPSMSEISS